MQLTRILPELQCSLVCEDVRREGNGKFIIIGVLNVVFLPQVPFGARLCIFNQWTRGVGQFRENVRLVGPDQKVLSQGEVKFELKDPTHHASNLSVFGVRFDAPGVYHLEVLVDDIVKLKYPLPVSVVPPPSGPATGNVGQ